MLSNLLQLWLFLAIVVLLAVNIWNISYLIGVMVSFVSQVFNLLSYLGASCDTIVNVSWILTWSVILLIIAKITKHFLAQNW